jgi:hypothetical protein
VVHGQSSLGNPQEAMSAASLAFPMSHKRVNYHLVFYTITSRWRKAFEEVCTAIHVMAIVSRSLKIVRSAYLDSTSISGACKCSRLVCSKMAREVEFIVWLSCFYQSLATNKVYPEHGDLLRMNSLFLLP